MLQSFRQSALPAFGYYFLLAVSALIATLGLLANSAATIIGAMIISPLMHPIMTFAFGLSTRQSRLIGRGILMLVTGVILVVLVSYIINSLLGIRVTGSEVQSRVQPNYLDMGVALGCGAAGAFMYTRRSIANTLAGVAIAVALVPPLCVVGISFQAGLLIGTEGVDTDMWVGALILFLTNLWGIVFVATMVFVLQGYGKWKYALSGIAAAFFILLLIMVPLGESFQKMYIRELFFRELLRYKLQERKFSEVQMQDISINLRRGSYRVEVSLQSNIQRLDRMNEVQDDLDTIAQRLATRLDHPVRIEMNIIPFYHIRSDTAEAAAESSTPIAPQTP
jgi:uncharacterized hydrophobic protein (TIGR00271 family)